MPSDTLGLITTSETPQALTVGLKRDLGLVSATATLFPLIAAQDGGEAVEYAYVNVGVQPLSPSGEAVEYAYVNVGFLIVRKREAVEYAYLNVDDAAALPPAHLVALIPNFGVEGSAFRLVALGAGETAVERTSEVLFGAESLTIDGWTHVPATASGGDQYIDVDAGETNMEHTLIDVTVPAEAQTAVVYLRQDDGV